jgi:ABC-type uncharacterized transport system substrate-binding protein
MVPEDGLMVAADAFLWANRRLTIDLAARAYIPTIYSWSGYVAEGGLMPCTIDQAQLWRGAAGYVDQTGEGSKTGGTAHPAFYIVRPRHKSCHG